MAGTGSEVADQERPACEGHCGEAVRSDIGGSGECFATELSLCTQKEEEEEEFRGGYIKEWRRVEHEWRLGDTGRCNEREKF